MKKVFLIFYFLCSNMIYSQSVDDKRANTPIPFTLADRDRLIKMDIKIEEMEKRNEERFILTQKQFEVMQKQMDDVKTEVRFVLGLIIGLIGFILWDRTTLVKPIERRLKKVEEEMKEFHTTDRNKLEQLICST